MGRRGRQACPLIAPRWLAVLLFAPFAAARADSFELRPAHEFASAASALDPVSFVMAQAAPAPGTLPAGPRVGPPPAPPPQRPASLAFMRLLFQDNAENGGLRMAPLRWRGSVSLEQRYTQTDEGGKRNQTLEFTTVDVSTYVGQPWLMQVRGNLGLLAAQQRSDGLQDGSRGNAAFAGDRTLNLTGGGTVSVFPSSRFPFTASFEQTDSRASGEATGSDYVNRMLALRQSYRTPLGDQIYAGSLQRSSLHGSFGRDTVTALDGTMQRTFPGQVVDLAGSYSQSRRSDGALGSDVSRIFAHHSYRPEEAYASVDSYASLSMTDLESAVFGVRSRYMQLNSFGSWRPDEDSPWFVTGGARFADATSGSGDADSSARSAGMNLAASYALSPHATLSGATSVTRIEGGNSADVVTSQSVAANYSPAPLTFAGFSYSWATAASAANQTGGVDGGQHAYGAQANHQVGRGFSFGRGASVTASVNQGVSWQDDSTRDPTRTLSHSGSLALRVTPTLGSDAFLSVNVGDSRSTGGREDHFQLLNVQLSGQLQLGVFSLLTANLTMQGLRQRLEGELERRTTVQKTGNLAYQHTRLFGVPRLRFVAGATFADVQLESRLQGDVAAPRDQVSRLYEARLQYDIGRLDVRLGTRFATIDGKTDRQLFFRVNRQFGLY